MKIAFNSNPVEIEENTTLEDFLQSRNLDNQGGMAVARNNQVVPRQDWKRVVLKENDTLLVIGAYYGG